MKVKKLELELHNFRVDSTGWKTRKDGNKINRREDIIELPSGEQLFTWWSARRETQKAGKRPPTMKEWCELEKEIKNEVYAGYFDVSGKYHKHGAHYRSVAGMSPASEWHPTKSDMLLIRCIKNAPQTEVNNLPPDEIDWSRPPSGGVKKNVQEMLGLISQLKETMEVNPKEKISNATWWKKILLSFKSGKADIKIQNGKSCNVWKKKLFGKTYLEII